MTYYPLTSGVGGVAGNEDDLNGGWSGAAKYYINGAKAYPHAYAVDALIALSAAMHVANIFMRRNR